LDKRENARHDRRCKTVHLQPKSSRLLHQIDDTARELRHELLKTISPRDLQTCLRVLIEIRHKAAMAVAAHSGNGNGFARKKRQTT
jgi:DNA-binding MarR family transcriptional regulator